MVSSCPPFMYRRRQRMTATTKAVLRAVLYVRVSTQEQTRSGYSLPEQRHALERHARGQGWEVVGTVADEGDSGANPNRRGLLCILELAEAGKIDVVVSLWRDRLFRDIYARRGFEQDLAEYGVRTLALNDTGSRIGDGVLDLLAEQQREDIAQKVRNGRKGKARTGKLPGGARVSWGFRLTEDRSNFQVDPEAMRHVRRVFEMVGARGRSLTHVKNAFEREGIATPGGSAWWACSTVRRIIQNDVYLARPAAEVAALVEPEVAATLDPAERFGIYWYGQFQASRNYTGRKAYDVRPQDEKDWIAVPVPDSGVPPKWVLTARERIRANTRFQPSTDPRLKLRGFIRCECGRSMTTYQSRGNRYYACRVHRQRGACENTRFHRMDHVEATVERFVLGLLRDPETFRERVEEQAEAMRRELRSGESTARALRKELDGLDRREDNLVEAIASLGLSTRLTEKFQEELDRIQDERENVRGRLEGVSDVEEQARKLREIPRLVEDYLRDLPYLVDFSPVVREYEVVPPKGAGRLEPFTLTPERIRYKGEEELEAERRAVLEARRDRFREIYSALGLTVVCRADGTLEMRWRGGCSEWRKGTSACCTA